jgi:Ser-tRNA(Ala) deacylase AlaX
VAAKPFNPLAMPIPAWERDPYLVELDVVVRAAGDESGRPWAVLSDTILYPEGGGQPSDRGFLNDIRVLDVQKCGGEVRHYLERPVAPGPVTIRLDWGRRFDHMQQHTAQHLLTAVAQDRFGWETTAFHLGERVSDIELDTPSVRLEELTGLEEAVAAEVRAARPVTSRRVSPEEYARLPVRTRGLPEGYSGSIRLVEIEGVDFNTCGGTHLRSTAEIEALKLLGTEPMRGGTRLFYAAGARLRRLLGAHGERNARLRQLLCTSDDELVAGMAAKLEQLNVAQHVARELEEELAAASAHVLAAASGRVLTAHWPRRDLPFLQRVAREVGRLAPDQVVLLTAGEGEQGAFLLGAGEHAVIDVPAVGRGIAELLGGRGGGSGRVFQGKAKDLSRRAEAVTLLESGLEAVRGR